MKDILLKLAAVVLMSAPVAAFAVPILNVGGSGQLLGASGVDVDGTLYDVAFLDGTCTQVYGTCEPSSFTFQTSAAAQLASQALLDMVFVDIMSIGNFDTDPSLTAGCAVNLAIQGCSAFTPFALLANFELGDILASVANNEANEDVDFTQLLSVHSTDDFAHEFLTWARWTPHTTITTIPAPGTLALILLGLLTMRSGFEVKSAHFSFFDSSPVNEYFR